MLAQNHRPLRMTRPISTSVGDSPRNLNQITTGAKKTPDLKRNDLLCKKIRKRSWRGAFWKWILKIWRVPNSANWKPNRSPAIQIWRWKWRKKLWRSCGGKVGRLCLGDFCGELAEWKTRLKRNEAFADSRDHPILSGEPWLRMHIVYRYTCINNRY